jgi:hypothetical protein
LYAEENDYNVDRKQANESNCIRTANRDLKRIKYGNRMPNRDSPTWQATDPSQLPNDIWMCEVVIEHADHDADRRQLLALCRCVLEPALVQVL